MTSKFIWIVLLSSIIPPVNAQDATPSAPRHSVGFLSGYGGQIGLNEAYFYEVVFLQGQYYFAVLRRKKWGVELVAQPQYNLTRYRPCDKNPTVKHGYETGLNIGLLVRKNLLREYLGIYILFSAGPHYVSGVPERQVNGFIFSDNILAGLRIKITNRFYLDIRSGFRHISNANLEQPNGGVDTIIFSGGGILTLP